jgi:DNA-directed RNA polymerase alpha subunit
MEIKEVKCKISINGTDVEISFSCKPEEITQSVRYIQNLSLEDDSIESLGLSARASIVLNRNNIHRIKELVQNTENDLLKLKDLGKNSVTHIKNKLMSKNLSLSL